MYKKSGKSREWKNLKEAAKWGYKYTSAPKESEKAAITHADEKRASAKYHAKVKRIHAEKRAGTYYDQEKRAKEGKARVVGKGEPVIEKPVAEIAKEPDVRPTIKLTPKKEEKKGIAAYREKKTAGGYAAKVITSPVTTAVLAGVALTGLAAIGGGTAAAGTAVITRTAFKGGLSMTTQRAFIGKSATSGVDKIFHKVRPIATRYAVNPKSHTLTKGVFSKLGLSLGAAGIAVGAIGSYPFAGFIKEEAVQTLNIPIMSALHNDDIEGAKLQVAAIDEILNNKDSIMSKIPYLNVLSSLSGFFKAAEVSNNEWKRIIGEIETQGSFAEKKREEGVQERQESAEYYAGVEEERKQKDLEEMEWKAEYYTLIREGRYEEAEELLQTQMKGGD